MTLDHIKSLDQQHFMEVYTGRYPVCFSHGEGCQLTDIDGKTYTDFMAGIAVNALGYNHPALTKAVCDKASTMMHCSNLFYVREQAELVKKLCGLSFADRVFLTNSGSEANEGAIKLARRYFSKQGIKRHKVITLTNSFHGRTFAMVAATGQVKYQKVYEPLCQGFLNVPAGDMEALAKAIDHETCAIMMELIQGEGGVMPMDPGYVQAIRELCDDHGILLIFDEVQTGIGRTGKLFGYENYDVTPDIMTLAKALGGGVPVGALLSSEKASAFTPGDHGTTFGGNPLACAAALAVFDTIEKEDLLTNCQAVGANLGERLESLVQKHSIAQYAQGMGLMWGLKIVDSVPIMPIILGMLDQGFIIGPSGHNTLRFVPPLIITIPNVDHMIDALDHQLTKQEWKS